MITAFAALALAVSAHAAPGAISFEQSLMQVHTIMLTASAQLISQEQFKKVDKNVQLTANQAWQDKSNLDNLVASARVHRSDPMISGQLNQLEQDLDIYARNCDVVRKQALELAQTAVKDPTLVELAKKLYQHARVLDSNAGYLVIDARNSNSELGVAGYGAQAYQIQRLAEAGADLTPDTREAAKAALDKIQ
jgi:hypothetical protein